MIYSNAGYSVDINISCIGSGGDIFIIISLLYELDTYICRTNVKDIIGFDVITHSIDDFINFLNGQITAEQQLKVSYNSGTKIFSLMFLNHDGMNAYKFDCIYDTIINNNNKQVRLLKTINSLSNINNLSPDKLDININLIGLLLQNIKPLNMDIIMSSLCNNLNLISLFENNLIINLTNRIDSNLLMFAAEQGNIEAVMYFVEYGININLKNKFNNTALLYAVYNGNVKIVKYLVEHGADITVINNDGHNSLMVAASNNNIELVKYLASIM